MAAVGKQALVSISSRVHGDGAAVEQEDAVHLLTNGVLYQDAQGYRLCYDELLDESTPPQHVTLAFTGETISMEREGDYQASMVFTRGTRYEGQYSTPMGAMDMAIYCTKLNYHIDELGGEMTLQYQLDLDGQFVAMRDMLLNFSLREDEH